MASSSTSGRPLRGQAREIVFNVYQHLKEQKERFRLKYNVTESTSTATGVSLSSVRRVVAEGRQSLARGSLTFSTPKGKNCERKKRIEVDNFTRDVIRRKIHDFYVIKKTPPTIKKLKAVLEEDNVLTCSREFLRKTLKNMGFRWVKCQSKRKILMEKPEIVSWRTNFLRDMRHFRQTKRNIVYLDETYVNKNHLTPSCWQSEREVGASKEIGKGSRIIIIHAGGEQGFVPNALKIWQPDQSKKKKNVSNNKQKKQTTTMETQSDDYHDDMNYNNFSRWVSESLLPNLPNNSVIVMDNASYHNKEENKKPTSTTLKKDIQDWLAHNGVTFTPDMTKAELLVLSKTLCVTKSFSIDKLFLDKGHTVIRLPPYHADLNPIELVWGDIKGRIGESLSSSLSEKKELCKKLFSEYTQEKWKKCVEHVKNIEELYWTRDSVIEETVDSLIISLSNNYSDDSSSESSCESSDSDEQNNITEEIRILPIDEY